MKKKQKYVYFVMKRNYCGCENPEGCTCPQYTLHKIYFDQYVAEKEAYTLNNEGLDHHAFVEEHEAY